MTECPLILDLLPLYIDDAISAQSRALVTEHLATCARCRQALAELQAESATPLSASLPEGVAPSEDARFLVRLKRQLGTIMGLALLLLLLVPYLASWYGHRQADQKFGQAMAAQHQENLAALTAIAQASPDPMARLKGLGVDLTYTGSRQGGDLRLTYTLTAAPPVDHVIPISIPESPSFRLYDPAGAKLGAFRQSSDTTKPDGPTEGDALFSGVAEASAQATVQWPYLGIYLKPEQELRWEIQRPGDAGDVLIGRRFTVADTEFEVERVRFNRESVEIDYRQITDPAQVGVHLLTFRLSDRMGGNWGDDFPRPQSLPDPMRPSERFELVTSPSQNWSVQVQYAVLALPGPTLPLEVK